MFTTTTHRTDDGEEPARSRSGAAILCALLLASLTGPLSAQGSKLGTIDVQKILTESIRGKALLAELEQYQKSKRDELLAKQNEIEKLQGDFSRNRLTLAEDRLAEMQKEIEDKTIGLRRAQDDAEREFQKRQQREFKEIENALLPIISEVGAEMGFTMLFNKFQSGLVYADEAADITNIVIERFNNSSSGTSGAGN